MAEKLSDFLKRTRTDKGYSLKEAYERTGISAAYLWQLENGKREIPRPKTLKKLADGYGVPGEVLLDRAGFPSKPPSAKTRLNTEKAHLLQDYEKLSPSARKELEEFTAFLRQRDAKRHGALEG